MPTTSCRTSIERHILAVLHSRLRSSHRSSVMNGMLVPAETLVSIVYSSTLIAKCPYLDSQVNVVYFPTLMVKCP